MNDELKEQNDGKLEEVLPEDNQTNETAILETEQDTLDTQVQEDAKIDDQTLTKKSKRKFFIYFLIMLTSSVVYLICKIFDPLKGINQSELQSGNIVNFTKYIMYLTIALTFISFLLVILYLTKIIKFNKEKILAKINDILDWFVIFPVCIMIVSICFTFFFTFTIVDGKSMEPTLINSEEMLLNYNAKKERFSIVVLKVSNEYENVTNDALYVKRIIGLPGDYVEYKTYMVGTKQKCDLYINGNLVEESFYGDKESYGITTHFYFETICAKNGLALVHNDDGKVVIPEGYYLVLGDNRSVSKDSREEEDIIGTIKYKVNSLFSYEKIN